jgi:glycerol-3-phosphate dehydrogenase
MFRVFRKGRAAAAWSGGAAVGMAAISTAWSSPSPPDDAPSWREALGTKRWVWAQPSQSSQPSQSRVAQGKNQAPKGYCGVVGKTPGSKRESEVDCDVLVVGAGVVGLAVARELAVRGNSVVVLEKDACVCAGASSGNSGIGCTGYDAPPGSLERLLLRRSIRRHPHLYRSLGLSYDHVRKCGALVVAWTAEELSKLDSILKENLAAGDSESRRLTRGELLDLEPAMSEDALGAVWAPREMVTEPWLVPIAFANSALLHGAQILTGKEMVSARVRLGDDQGSKIWKVRTRQGDLFHARSVINCGGLYGDHVDGMCLGPGNKFEIRPRKGQFVVFEGPADGASVDGDCGGVIVDDLVESLDGGAPTMVIEPVPTLRTKGVIVWQSVYGNIVCGPTAEEQTSRTDRGNDSETIAMLKETARRVCPSLANAKVVGTYAGIRPATEHRDYQIRSIPGLNMITVGGIRSTGLTAASGIAEFVAALHTRRVPFDSETDDPRRVLRVLGQDRVLPPYTPSAALQPDGVLRNPPAPTLAELAADFARRGDGTVGCFGRNWTVTHPLSALGMKTLDEKERAKREKKKEAEAEAEADTVRAAASGPTLHLLPASSLSQEETRKLIERTTERMERHFYDWTVEREEDEARQKKKNSPVHGMEQ